MVVNRVRSNLAAPVASFASVLGHLKRRGNCGLAIGTCGCWTMTQQDPCSAFGGYPREVRT